MAEHRVKFGAANNAPLITLVPGDAVLLSPACASFGSTSKSQKYPESSEGIRQR